MKKAIVVLFGAALFAAGCGDDTGGTVSTGQSSAASGSSASQKPAGAPKELEFEGKTLDGKAFKGASLAGKPVVFWFWAPWCPKCIGEGPAVAKAAAKYKGQVSFVGIGGLDDSPAKLKGFVSRTGTRGVTHLDDRDGTLYSHFKVTQQSSYLFLSPDGTTSKDSGPLDESALDGHIEKLIG